MLLLGLVCLSDLFAFILGISINLYLKICLKVFTMAFGSRISLGNSLDAKSLVQSVLVNDQHWEYFLGPFWPYLLAIIFHMTACAMICFVAIYRRYRKFLTVLYYLRIFLL